MSSIFSVQDYVYQLNKLTWTSDNGKGQKAMGSITRKLGGKKKNRWCKTWGVTLLTELTTADIIYSFLLNAIEMRIKNNE